MATKERPLFWSDFHTRCTSRLTRQFQALALLKFSATDGAKGYADLVEWGYAEVRLTPIMQFGIVVGTLSEYRMAA